MEKNYNKVTKKVGVNDAAGGTQLFNTQGKARVPERAPRTRSRGRSSTAMTAWFLKQRENSDGTRREFLECWKPNEKGREKLLKWGSGAGAQIWKAGEGKVNRYLNNRGRRVQTELVRDEKQEGVKRQARQKTGNFQK